MSVIAEMESVVAVLDAFTFIAVSLAVVRYRTDLTFVTAVGDIIDRITVVAAGVIPLVAVGPTLPFNAQRLAIGGYRTDRTFLAAVGGIADGKTYTIADVFTRRTLGGALTIDAEYTPPHRSRALDTVFTTMLNIACCIAVAIIAEV